MQAVIEAIVMPGHQVASGTSTKDTMFNADGGTIHMQTAEFKKRGLDLDAYLGKDWVRGTLNLSVAPQRRHIAKPKYFFEGVRWTDLLDKPGQPPFLENFFLDEAVITFKGKSYKAVIYIPDPSTKPGHFQPPTEVEVIAQKIPGITYGDTVELHYNPNAVTFGVDAPTPSARQQAPSA